MARALAIIALLAAYAAMTATTELLSRVALWWLDHKPFSAEAKARRQAKRKAARAKREGPLPDLEILPPNEDFMTEAQLSMIRGVLKWVSGFLALKGIIDAGDAAALQVVIEAVLSAGLAVYAFWASHRKHTQA